MTILEVQPGGGWWTDILAPYAHATGGKYYATAADLEIQAREMAYMRTRMIELLAERDASDVVVFGGGIIPADDIPVLKEMGVAEVFLPGSSTQDVIRLMFGYDAEQQRLLGMRVLDNKETPGLGDAIVKDEAFVGEFDGVATPVVGVKKGAGRGGPGEVDMITGATISSRTVISVINHRIEALQPLLAAYLKGRGS